MNKIKILFMALLVGLFVQPAMAQTSTNASNLNNPVLKPILEAHLASGHTILQKTCLKTL